ncbi:DNA primase [Candidatus Jorgensenbacteria bacterium RIFCSPLOWO2_02_FULL_45_12]|uniref:DNA primase n=1 Tax=Candidatus Jorgensenbacteria bacterium GW2011_GWA2_45_9 TaxID=1618663 RepID=A0A0G1N287_9BACT|nr:MAG: primase protein [Candidatus Jorgensenbacteria bacterium GW2011_GWA2_45_9]OGG42570.1 MAG: DNA primase [Candidatus Jorgensenbacteria bacterium RIFCSPLOWO2_02_FULL_45_12]
MKETELIKQKLDIAEFLRSYITLFPAGRNFKALCPFHPEKTPSFVVSPEKGIWHCFGCGEGGDAFKFLMRYENIEFPEALRFLAERAGVQLQNVNPAEQREFGVLYDMHVEAANFFRSELKKNQQSEEYLNSRKLLPSTVDEFSIGFAPGGDSLTLHLIKKGFDMHDISRAGLSQKSAQGLYRDKFERRIIFPIFNSTGKICAFAGRIFLEGDPSSAKYLNSPETPIYNKSKILYGFSHSKREIAETHSVFIVEGYMDFLMSWQSGVKNAVAVAGTALTRDHLQKLRRFADTVVMSFDNDEAGFRALERGMDIFGPFDFHVKAVDLDKYKDPAEACEENPEFLKKSIAAAAPAFQTLIKKFFPGGGNNADGDLPSKKRALRRLLEKIARMKSSIERERWLRELADKSDVRETTLTEELAEIGNEIGDRERENNEPARENPAQTKKTRVDLISERLLLMAFAKPEFSSILKTSCRDILPPAYFKALDGENAGQENNSQIYPNNEVERVELLKMKASSEFSDVPEDKLKKEFDELVRYLSIERLKDRREILRKDIQKSESAEDGDKLKKEAAEFHSVSKRINELQKNG